MKPKSADPVTVKTAPRVLIFSIAMGADYSFELISIVHSVPQFIGHNKIFLGSVHVQKYDYLEVEYVLETTISVSPFHFFFESLPLLFVVP